MKSFLRLAAVAALALFCASCTSMSVKTQVSKISADYKSSGHTEAAKIEVIEEGAASRPFVEIASIKATGYRDIDRGELVKAMRERAARLGADAIAELKFSETPIAGGAGGEMVCPFDGGCYYQQTDSTIIGMPTAECKAIKYNE